MASSQCERRARLRWATAALLAACCANSAAVSAQTLPAPWTSADVGNPATAGSATASDGRFTIRASGTDIWGTADQFHFVYRQVTGNVDLIARVDSVTAAHSWSKAGVMVRASLAADSAHAYVMASASRGLGFQRRRASAATSLHTEGGAVQPPSWTRLVRTGNSVTAYVSADGLSWTKIGSDSVALGATVYVGLAVTSHAGPTLTTGVMSAVSVSVPAATAPLRNADIGEPAARGHVLQAGGTLRISGAGLDIWEQADQFHYVYQPLSGDGDVRVRIASLEYLHRWTKAGVMIRESLAPGSRHASALVSADRGYAFQRRVDTGGISLHTEGGLGRAPGWLRLVRTGSQFEAYRSTDGQSWTLMGSDTVPMGSDVLVGIAVTSHLPGTLAEGVFDSYSVTAASAPNVAPSVSLTAPANGATFTAPANTTISATASDSDGQVERVEFFVDNTLIGTDATAPYSAAWSSVPAGTYTLSAVAYDNAGESTRSATATVTVNSSVNQRPTVSITSPTSGATFQAPATVGITADAVDAEGAMHRVEFFANGNPIGTDTTAPYSVNWTNVAAGSYSLTAVAYDTLGQFRTSAAVSITVTAANVAPSVTLTSPAAGSNYTAPASITLNATASDPEGAMSRVEFFSNGTRLFSDTVAPYSFAWTNVPAGSYSLTAVAYDTSGASRSTAAVTVTVTQPNQAPTVTLTSPANGASFVAPASITLAATASDPEGAMARVEFFANGTRIGTDTDAPYSLSWTNVAAGTYSITAIAFDSAGASRTSAPASVTVTAASSAPRLVVFTASSDHAAVTRYVLEIFASGADPATATPVASSDLGKPAPDANNDITVDRSTFFSGLAAGNYIASVRAENGSGSSRSAPVSFTR